MDLLLSWVAFPLALAAVCTGCGLAVEALLDRRLPGPLVPACGLALVVAVGQFLTLTDGTAELTTPAVVALAVAGAGLAALGRRPVRPPAALVAAAAAVFAVFAAPVVLSGEPTIAGFIKLDDTATWLAFTDQIMERGRDLDGLAPSTYSTVLADNIGEGYPVGTFVPLGVGSRLVGADPAFLIQPYMAFLAVILALGLWWLARPLVTRPWPRAAAVFIAAQPALLVGYYLWGGVKELFAVAMIAAAAALAEIAAERPRDWRPLVPLALVTAALMGGLSAGGLVWVAPVLAAALVILARTLTPAGVAARALAFSAGVAFLALPVILPGGLLPPTASPLSDSEAKGNLIQPLDPLQVAGIWPVGDFRLPPNVEPLSYGLAALAVALAAIGAGWAWRRRATGALMLVAAGVVGCVALTVAGSPWVDGKALATASPIVLFAAMIGLAALHRLAPPALTVAAAVAIAGGVLWSTALAYRDVNLAPYDQLEELEEIGEVIAGEGPALMTEYSPYGARHFLRQADAEAASERRRHPIPQLDGTTVAKGYSVDTDRLDPAALGFYRTLVLRRSPAQSRPPSAYRLTWEGDSYEVWQRPADATVTTRRLPLGSPDDPTAKASCERILALAAGSESLVAATRAEPVVTELDDAAYPDDWRRPTLEATPLPSGAGTLAAPVRVSSAGEYEAWLLGSVRPRAELAIDGEPAGSVRHELNNEGQYVHLGSASLEPGLHEVEVRVAGSDLHPGSGGRAVPVGPLTLSRADAAESRIVRVRADAASELCGRQWDWIEAG